MPAINQFIRRFLIALTAACAGSLAFGQAPLALLCEMQAAPLGVEEVRPQLSWQLPWTRTGARQTPHQLVMVEDPEFKKIMTKKSKPIAPMALECEDMVNPVIEMQEPQLSWKLSDTRHGAGQTAYQILVSSTIENLAEGEGDLWNSGKQNSDQSILVTYKGKLLKSRQRVYWKVRYWDQNGEISPYSETASWRMGLLSDACWQAHWITSPQMKESASPVDSFLKAACSSPNTKNLFAERKPSIYFRKEFVIKGKIQDAIVRICGLGAFNLYVNGKKVGDAFLDPIQSDYDKLAYYRNFEVTSRLCSGLNIIGVEVSDGWYGQYAVWNGTFGYGDPRILLEVEYTDTTGKQSFIGTDTDWKVHFGPTRRSNVYIGEMYDARLETTGWTEAGYDATGWVSAIETNPGSPRLALQIAPSIRSTRTIHPVSRWSPLPGVWIFDFGQNFAGVVKINVPGYKRGTIITLQMGEFLKEDKTISYGATEEIGFVQTQVYVCKSGEVEKWQPSFCYFGFRYAQVTGLPEEPDLNFLEGIQLRTDVKSIGSFRCSYDLFNKMHQLAVRTLESNIHGVIEDCPTREKCGWLQDAYASLDTWQMNFRLDGFYRKFIDDIRQTYHENGLLGEIAGGKRKYGPPAMLDYMVATLIIPWSHYQYSGDRRELERHYEFMKRFAEASYPIIMERYQTGNLKLTRKERFFFGDWGDVTADGSRPPNEYILFPAETPAMLTGTQSIIYGLHCLSGTAAVLGKEEDRKHYSGMADELVKMVNQFYFDESLATYGSQCANAWAHFLNMVPGESAKRFQIRFGEEIKTVDRNQMTVGQIGLGRIFQELTESGNGKLIQILTAMEADHGFKCMLDRGATTLWEFQGQGIPVPSGSLNHPAFSGYDAWFYNYLGGIRPLADFAGFKKFLLKPYFAPWIDWIDVTYESPYGIICSEWKKSKEKTATWKVTIPPNTSALVRLPVTDPEKVTESGRPVSASSSVRLSERENGRVVYEVQSGKYEFNFLIESGLGN